MKAFLRSFVLLASVVCIVGCTKSKTFPAKELTFIVQSAPGGPSDFVGQTLSITAAKYLGKKINVFYKPGGSGSIGMSALAQSKPDGYTIGLVAGELALLKALGIADLLPDNFTAIMLVLKVPSIVAVPADAPYNNIAELVAYAKKANKPLTVGNAGTGSIWALAGLEFAKAAGIQLTPVPFDGGGPAKVALLGHHIDMVTIGLGDVLNEARAGKVKILGVMSKDRVQLAPEVPTLREQGFDLQFGSWLGIAAPKNLPEDIRTTLYNAFKKSFDEPQVVTAYAQRGYVHEDLNPTEFEKFMQNQVALFAPLLQKTQAATKAP